MIIKSVTSPNSEATSYKHCNRFLSKPRYPWLLLVVGITCTLAMPSAARAQWTTTGSDISNTNSGNVGVGTTGPSRKLSVVNTAAQSEEIIGIYRPASANTSAGRSRVAFEFRGDAYSDNPNIFGWSMFPGTVMAKISVVPQSFSEVGSGISGTHASLGFFVSSAGHGGLSERMTIVGNGKVGIGITTPIYSLDVNGGVNAFRTKAATTSSSDAIATFENSSAIQMIVRGNGNVGIGTVNPANKLHVAGNITVDGNVAAKYQDVAEWVDSSQDLTPGTVVVLDASKANQVVASAQAYDSRVAGVISERPGLALGEKAEGRVLVATTGRIKMKVDATRGPIQIGDLLVTSGKEGFAMKSVPVEIGGVQIHRPGTLIGKALEPLLSGQGEILVLLSLQ